MKEKTMICQKLAEEGADSVMLEQYLHYEKTGNKQGMYRLVCRFRRAKWEELKKEREKLSCLDYMIAKIENASENKTR